MTTQTITKEQARKEAAEKVLQLMSAALPAQPDWADPDQVVRYTEHMNFMLELKARAEGAINLTYVTEYDTVEIEGIGYAMDVFRTLGIAPLGSLIRILKRQDGVLYLRVEREGDDQEQQAYAKGVNDGLAVLDDEGNVSEG